MHFPLSDFFQEGGLTIKNNKQDVLPSYGKKKREREREEQVIWNCRNRTLKLSGRKKGYYNLNISVKTNQI